MDISSPLIIVASQSPGLSLLRVSQVVVSRPVNSASQWISVWILILVSTKIANDFKLVIWENAYRSDRVYAAATPIPKWVKFGKDRLIFCVVDSEVKAINWLVVIFRWPSLSSTSIWDRQATTVHFSIVGQLWPQKRFKNTSCSQWTMVSSFNLGKYFWYRNCRPILSSQGMLTVSDSNADICGSATW